MTAQSRTHSPRFAAMADSIAGITDPSMADERERDIVLRACAVAMVASVFTIQALAVLFAVIGVGLWSSIIMVATVVPTLVYSWYSKSAGLDSATTFAKISPRRSLKSTLAGIIAAALWIAAVGYHMASGSPLLDVGISTAAPADGSTLSGLITGGLSGALIAIIALMMFARAARRRVAAEEARDDED